MDADEDKIKVSVDEVFRAQLGFETVGSHKLSNSLENIEFEYDSDTVEVDVDVARALIADNLALLQSLRGVAPTIRVPEYYQTLGAAVTTVTSGLAAIEAIEPGILY